jgi:Ni/Fe-hydrogenase subunit HybB-like protein
VSADQAKPRSLPAMPAGILGALALVGFAVFLVAASSSDPDTSGRAWRAFLQNFLLWATLAQGALMLSAGMRLTNARWAGPIHRIVDSLGAFVPVSILLFFVLWAGRAELLEWMENPAEVEGKEWWFRTGFMFWRDLIALLWMGGLSVFYLYLSIRPTLGRARETTRGWQAGIIQSWTSGWRGEAKERDLGERRCRKLAAVLAVSYAFAYSTIGLDWIMGLSPHWVSTLFPAYYAWGGFLSAVSMTTFLCVVLSNGPDLRGQITENRRHDLGKMIFAFSIFWMYLFWSQYIVIWYGNIPEETGFVGARLGSQFLQDYWYMDRFWEKIQEPYVRITLTAWILCWVVPFWVLLGQKPKKTPAILGTVALGSVIGFWIERYILITPSIVTPEAVLAGAPVTMLGFVELATSAGFVGLFFLVFLVFAKVLPGAVPTAE